MLNRRWLPEGEHLRIISSSFSHVDLEGVEPRLFCQKEPFIIYERAWATLHGNRTAYVALFGL